MKKTILCFLVLSAAGSAFAGGNRFNTTKDGAGYEASLRQAGIPLSGGMVWPVVQPGSVMDRQKVKSPVNSAGSVTPKGKTAV
jgi:hypothetical protein